jgi:RHS repeat-associated protein
MDAALHAGSFLAAGPCQPLSGNLHPGSDSCDSELRRVIELANVLNASGLAASLYDDRRRSRDTAKERDAESGLDYFGARYYGSALGRFTSTDPNQASASLFEPQSWNQYSYVWNRPFSYTDPNGKNPLLVTAAIGAGVGALVGGGFELASQLGKNGYSLDDVKWGKVGTAALGGGVAGGITGLTLGLGSAAGITLGTGATVAVNAGANIIGGEVQRQANDVLGIESAPTGADEVAAVAFDGVWGGVGGLTGGRIADELFPLPNVRKEIQLLQFANRRSTRPAQIQSFRSAANQQFNLNAATSGVQGGLRTSVYTWWSQLFWNASSQSKKEPKACTEAHDSSGQGTGTVCH